MVQLGADHDVGNGAQQLAVHVADHVPSAAAAAASKDGRAGELCLAPAADDPAARWRCCGCRAGRWVGNEAACSVVQCRACGQRHGHGLVPGQRARSPHDPVIAFLGSAHDLKPTPPPLRALRQHTLLQPGRHSGRRPVDWYEENSVAEGNEQLDGIDGDESTADLSAPLLDAHGLSSMMTEISRRLSSDADHLYIHQVCTHWRASTSPLAACRPWVVAGHARRSGLIPTGDYSLRLPRRGAQRMEVGAPPAGFPYCCGTSRG
ncbi:hypothetical protein C2845_PM10G04590 [Panicum miliaceum]|uniref:Uncharacterized protein n=1 Tax=Panicum miliaceum TaxID=4540 RepID=A0A3L6PDB0_PANMI|nr:hypothetical protein C2845_PM10G04590 [Panicum miliaceum]